MRLENFYYTLAKQWTKHETTCFRISLISDCPIYQGHFPGMPVSPGVCQIQMIKELVERLTCRQLQLMRMAQCKFMALITPDQHPELDVQIRELLVTESHIQVKAVIMREDAELLLFKGEFIPIQS